MGTVLSRDFVQKLVNVTTDLLHGVLKPNQSYVCIDVFETLCYKILIEYPYAFLKDFVFEFHFVFEKLISFLRSKYVLKQ